MSILGLLAQTAAYLPVLPLIALTIWIYYRYFDDTYNTWEKRGIKFIPGTFPFGSRAAYTRETEFEGLSLDEMYKLFPQEPYFGIYDGGEPFLVLRDPEMIRRVLVTDFAHFRDRQGLKLRHDDILQHHLFNLDGDTWRALRVKMSPVFTSGKLKAMFPLFLDVAENLDKLLTNKIDEDLQIKDVSGCFSTDIICSCAFGLESDTLNNADCELRRVGFEALKPSLDLFAKLKFLVMKYIPGAAGSLEIPKTTKKCNEDFMVKLVKDTVEHRMKTGHKRNDFIDLLIQLREKGILNEDPKESEQLEPIELTFELMTAQCFVFFLAGFETSSTVITYCLYEMAMNPEIQDRLHKEITDTLNKNGGKITYNAIKEMEYLDMVINETVRKYPTLVLLQRACSQAYTTPYGHRIEKGEKVIIPLWGIHRDPQYYPDPLKFDPERFSPENKDSIHPFVYLPFGEGPRICIGMRFGQLQVKIGIITFLRKYVFSPCDKTEKDIVYDPRYRIITGTINPITLRITRRNK